MVEEINNLMEMTEVPLKIHFHFVNNGTSLINRKEENHIDLFFI